MAYIITSRIETYTDHNPLYLRDWVYTDSLATVELDEAFMDGIIIFRKELVLELPQYSSTINLTTFINANNPDNYERIRVINNLIQPSIVTGLLTGLEVTLENNGDILGTDTGYTALTLQVPITLENNGYIKGAGGLGGTGSGGPGNSRSIGYWEYRASYDDGTYVEGQTSPSCSPGSTGPFYNRFWKNGGGAKSGAWVQTGCTNQHYFDTNSKGQWGDQPNTYADSKTPRCRYAGGIRMDVVGTDTEGYTASVGGAGGAGAHFGQLTPLPGSNGTTGTHYGPSGGFNPSTGYNLGPLSPPPPGGPGYMGGAFGLPGVNGGAAGNAITGQINILPASTVGNTIGDII